MRARLVDVPPVLDPGFDCGYPAFNDILGRLRPLLSTNGSVSVTMRALVSPSGSKTLGYIVFSRRPAPLVDERHNVLWIERVAVDHEFQRLGLASRILIPAAADDARGSQIDIIGCQGATDGGRALFGGLSPIYTNGVGKRTRYFFRTSALPTLSSSDGAFDVPDADVSRGQAPSTP